MIWQCALTDQKAIVGCIKRSQQFKGDLSLCSFDTLLGIIVSISGEQIQNMDLLELV